MQKHNHPLIQGCVHNDCAADRYVDDMHEFTDVTIDATNGGVPAYLAQQAETDELAQTYKALYLEANGKTENVDELIDRRRQVYGEPTETFPRIAQVWSGISGHEISALDVPLMLAGLKAVRAQVCPDYSDNSDDIEGFLAIFRELVGDDMIHARLVSEYIEKKYGDG
jgi:hypothetical protein